MFDWLHWILSITLRKEGSDKPLILTDPDCSDQQSWTEIKPLRALKPPNHWQADLSLSHVALAFVKAKVCGTSSLSAVFSTAKIL